jgi:hypothetical protein
LKLKYDELLSNVAFDPNVRRNSEGADSLPAMRQALSLKVGRCSLTLSNPR